MQSQFTNPHRPLGSKGFLGFDSVVEERPYHQSLIGVNPTIDEYKYFPDTDVEDNMSRDFNYNGSSFMSSSTVPYNSLTRASSTESMDFQFPTYDPRTANQGAAGQNPYINQQSKCRQLPCRTFISTGSCPYGDRCVFLHDPSIVSKPIYIRSKVS